MKFSSTLKHGTDLLLDKIMSSEIELKSNSKSPVKDVRIIDRQGVQEITEEDELIPIDVQVTAKQQQVSKSMSGVGR